MNNRKAPRIRFKGFTDDWEQRKLGDVLRTLPFKQFLKTPEQGGKYEIIQQGNEPIIGYANGEPCESFRNTVIFGDHTLSLYKPKKPFFVATDGVRILQGTNDMDGYYLLSLLEGNSLKSEGYKRYYSILLDREVLLTENHCEQVQIGLCFKHLDHLITLHQRKLEKLKIIKKAMLENCFPKNGEKVPRFRFSGFTGDWEQRKLGEIAPLRGGYAFKSESYTDSGIPIIRISNILSNGTVGDDFAYYDEQNEDEIYSLKNGSALLAMSGATTGKVSILKCKNTDKYYQNQRVGYFERKQEYDYGFVSTIVRSSLFIEQLTAVLVAGAQPNVSSKDIDSFDFFFPKCKEEQEKIGKYFLSIDHLITLHQRKLEKLKIIKKSFLEKMFV